MKKKVLLSSILTIALCLSLIAGSTFALFTDSIEFNIAVTSGDVEIFSEAVVTKTYSAEGPVDEYKGKYLEDENGYYYEHKEQTIGKFLNGGTAEVVDGTLTIEKLTPGDKVDVTIKTENKGNVSFRYRYTIAVLADTNGDGVVDANDNANELAPGMVLTAHSGEKYEAVKKFTSEWFDLVNAGDTITDLSKMISLELPVYAGNEYQSEYKDNIDENGDKYKENDLKSVTYQILVEAVQGNAVTTEDLTYVEIYPTQSALQLALDNDGKIDGNDEKFELGNALRLDGNKPVTISNADLNGKNIPAKNPNGSVTKWTITNIAGHDSYKALDLTLDNAKVQAPNGTNTSAIALYFNGTDDTAPENVVRLENGTTIFAGDGNDNFCIDVVSSKLTLYIDGTVTFDRANSTYAIHAAEGAILKIVVPDASAKAAIEPYIFNEGATITWEY